MLKLSNQTELAIWWAIRRDDKSRTWLQETQPRPRTLTLKARSNTVAWYLAGMLLQR